MKIKISLTAYITGFQKPRARGNASTLARCTALLACGAGLLGVPAHGAIWSWSGGGGANALWNNSANWGFAGIPATGDTVIFPASQPNQLNTNNIAGLVLNQVRFVGAGGGYDIRGTAFTVTNGIEATNTVGVNTIENNITLATVDQTVEVAASLTLSGVLSGTVGVTKTGLGTLLYQNPAGAPAGNNTYSGTTRVYAGVLQLNGGGTSVVGPTLVIGDGSGSGSPTVRLLQNSEIVDTAPVTINLNGLLDLNNFYEEIGNLTIQGGTAASGTTGSLLVNGNLTTLASATQALITGNLYFVGGMPVISVADGGTFYDLNCLANISDNGNGLFFTNSPAGTFCFVVLGGSNTISGPITLNNLTVSPTTSYSLGATNPVTVGGNGTLWLFSSGFTNKTLTLQAGATLTSQNNNTWAGPIVIGGNISINASYPAGTTLNLAGGISGTGNIDVTNSNPGWSLLLSGSTANSFNGDLSMQTGTLLLDNTGSGFGRAIPNNLFVGDATHSATNRFLANNQIGNGSAVTLYNGSLMDLNNFFDGIGSLVMYGANVMMGTGFLDMYSPGTIITPSPASTSASISGILGLQAACTFLITNDLISYAQIYAGGSLTKTGTGFMYLTASNSYAGLTSVQQGYLWVENNSALGSTNAGTVVSSGATLILSGNLGITNESLTLNGLGNSGYMALDCESGDTNVWAGPITLNADSNIGNYNSAGLLRLNGPISGAGGLIEGGQFGYAGTVSLEGTTANAYGGLTTVSTSCTLRLNKTGGITAIPGNLLIDGYVYSVNGEVITNTCDMTIDPTGTYELSAGHFENIDGLSGSGSVLMDSGSYIGLGYNNGSSIFSGTIVGPGYSAYVLYKAGSGTFTFNGTGTYANPTYVSAGTLLVNGNLHFSPVQVAGGALLGGSGTVGAIAANGTIAPGNSLGILNSSNVTFAASGNLTVSLAGPTPGAGYDQLNVTGTNTLAGATLSVLPAFATPVAIGQQFTILNNDLADAITGTFSGLAEGSTISAGTYKFTISYAGGTGNDVVLTLTSIPGAVAGSTVTSGDGSHGIDPNGCNNLALTITNTSGSAMTGINATLSTTTPGVLITQPYSPYPNIPANGGGTNQAPFQISTLPAFVCGTTINLQLSVDSSLGSFTMSSTLASGETETVPNRYDLTGNVGIPDIGTVDSTNAVSGFVGPLQKVTVSLFITHPFDSDLTNITLISPDGTKVLLSSANGGGSANYGSGSTPDSSRTTFDDAGGTAITAGAAPFVGTFRPQSPLSAFIGNGTPNGNWHLHIADGFGGSVGTLRAWSLFLTGNTCTTGSGACDYCLTSITGSITNTDPLMTDRFVRNSIVASCGAPKVFPGISVAGGPTYHYDLYTFTNTSGSDACVTVLLNGAGDIQAGIYLNAFDPSNIATNYVADSGGSTLTSNAGSPVGPQSCSAEIPAGAKFFVEVNEIANGGGSTNYTLQLSGLPCPPPTLNIQPVTTSQARLTWPTWAGGYLLEANPSLLQTNWASVTNEPIVSSLKFNVTNSTVTPTNRFYRLRQP